MKYAHKLIASIVCGITLLIPLISSAHEVYVLDRNEIAEALTAPEPDFLGTITADPMKFIGWGVLTGVLLLVVFLISYSSVLERWTAPLWKSIKKYSPMISQFTLGLALFASGYFKAAFGVELPFSMLFGSDAAMLSYVFITLGLMIIFGILPRLAGLATLAIFLVIVSHKGIYMFNYATYLGETLTLILFGGAYVVWSSKKVASIFRGKLVLAAHGYKFAIMRVLFGAALIYASLYAKLFHGALALETVEKYHLTNYFPFDPTFLVLGAMIVEIMIGVLFATGFLIRFTAIFFLSFVIMSLMFFGESVWPHIILIGTGLAMFCHGYDKYTISMWLQKRWKKNTDVEPVL